jgi:hypothetical protein
MFLCYSVEQFLRLSALDRTFQQLSSAKGWFQFDVLRMSEVICYVPAWFGVNSTNYQLLIENSYSCEVFTFQTINMNCFPAKLC